MLISPLLYLMQAFTRLTHERSNGARDSLRVQGSWGLLLQVRSRPRRAPHGRSGWLSSTPHCWSRRVWPSWYRMVSIHVMWWHCTRASAEQYCSRYHLSTILGLKECMPSEGHPRQSLQVAFWGTLAISACLHNDANRFGDLIRPIFSYLLLLHKPPRQLEDTCLQSRVCVDVWEF